MPICVRCRKEVGVMGGLLGFNKQAQRCNNCEKHITQALNRFRQAFINYCNDGVLSPSEWQQLHSYTRQEGVDWNEALNFVRGDGLHFLERILTFAAADGIITEEEEKYFHELRNNLAISHEVAHPIIERLNYLKYISDIRQGKLPTFRSSTHLESDEICHLEADTIYYKVNARSIKPIGGRLVVTNKKIHFLSAIGGWSILWKNVMSVQNHSRGIYLELSTKSGNGNYDVQEPLLVQAVIDTLARMAKRQLLAPQSDSSSRHIPQDVKNAVWHRDQGRCVQCSSNSYLEFDHIIPFSKGGASTIGNVQLLCRRCNLSKGDRL